MALLTRKDILAVKLPTADVDVPQLGGTVRLQAFSVVRRVDVVDTYMENLRAVKAYEDDQALPDEERKGLAPVKQYDDYALQLLYAIVDENGEPLLSVEDYDWFTATVPYGSIDKLWKAFKELNSVPTNEKVEEKKEPSDETTNESSSSD